MGLLPDIGPNGEFIYSEEDKLLRKQMRNSMISADTKRKFRQGIMRAKAKQDEEAESYQKVESEMAELNNMGHNEVTADFEDSPFADRQPLENEDE